MSWDEAAANFDDEPDHGLRDPEVKAAWAALLVPMVHTSHARIADLGCGTGSIAALFEQAGHEVHGVDQSPRMLEIARTPGTCCGHCRRRPCSDGSRCSGRADGCCW
jgi:predicted TPR repeat methyltransferase